MTLLFIPSQLDEPCRVGVGRETFRRKVLTMRQLKNMYVFLLLENRRKSSLFHDRRTGKDLWDFLLLSKHLEDINWLKSFRLFALTGCL